MIIRLDEIISASQAAFADNIALVDRSGSVTYRELDKKISLTSHSLMQNGLKKGERVGLISKNSVDFVSTYFAVVRAGGVAVPFNHTLDAGEMAVQAKDCAISAMYAGLGSEEKAKAVANNVKTVRFTFDRSTDNSAGDIKMPIIGEDDLCSIIYTSGTIDRPLGVMLSNKNIISNSLSVVKYLGLKNTDSIVCVLPFFYIYGLSVLFSYLLAGGKVIIDNRFMYPTTVLDSLDGHKATGFAGVSSHYSILLNKTNIRKRGLPYLRHFLQAGDGMNVKTTLEILKLFPGKRLYIMYGQTEASPRLTYLDPAMALRKPASVGKAIPGVNIKILSDAGHPCKEGEEGQIVARGDSIMLGYWERPDETAKTVKDGWLYTGDIAFKDKDGDIFITGRLKSFIKTGAHKVNPLEIEHLAMEDKRVLEAAAIGIPDDILGEKIRLFISPASEGILIPGDIMDLCKKHLPAFKVPCDIVILGALPRNSYGKVDKKILAGLQPEKNQ